MSLELNVKDIKHNVVIIKINKSYYKGIPARELYEYTRGYWKRTRESVAAAEYALAVSHGRVVEVYSIDSWVPAEQVDNILRTYNPEKYYGRIAFNGKIAPDNVREYYMDRDMRSLFAFGEANPIKLFLASDPSEDNENLGINTPRKPGLYSKTESGHEVLCPNCESTFRRAQRCPECGQLINYDGVSVTKSRYKSLEEWADNTLIEGADTNTVVDFVRSVCASDGFSYHLGTSDLVLEINLAGFSTNLFRFSDDHEVFTFQPKAIVEGLDKAGLSDSLAYEFMDNIRCFLSETQKNTPYERLNGYYNIDYSILTYRRDSLEQLLYAFYTSVNNGRDNV